MDYRNEHENYCFHHVFRTFVCVVLSLLLGLQVYTYFVDPQEELEGDFTDIKYMVIQLTKGLTEESFLGIPQANSDLINGKESSAVKNTTRERGCGITKVNRKHETLQREIERISESFPAVAAAAGRAKDALEPSRRSVRHPLDLHDYDRQMADYALETAGARIVDTGETLEHIVYDSPVSWVLHMISSVLCRDCPGASSIIRPGTLPGECWAFRGSRGEATIRLLGTVHVRGVSLEHIPSHISPTREISSAPRSFQLEGLEFRGDPYGHDFGTFEYNKDGKPVQYFEVLHPSSKGFSLVRLKIYTNWGHSVYTCVYRVRIHGELVSDQSRPTFLPAKDDGLQIENE